MTQQSTNLTTFYRAYRDWLDAGAPQAKPFYRHSGLCALVYRFARKTLLDSELGLLLDKEMNAQFLKELPEEREGFPFNPLPGSYSTEAQGAACHLNEMRVKWVRDHAE